MIDRALATIEAHGKGAEGGPGYVWTVPGWPMRTILWEGQHPERKKCVETALRRGNLVLHALPYTLHTATGDVETLARSFGHASSVAIEYGLDFPISAKMTDVPGHDWIIPTLLAYAGVKFFHFGSNPTNVQVEVPRVFWWEGPDGSRVLTMFSSGYDSGLLPPVDWPHKTWLAMVMSGDLVSVTAGGSPRTMLDTNIPISATPARTMNLVSHDRVTIGRAVDNQVVLNHPLVSSYHAVLERVGKRFSIKDLRSFRIILSGSGIIKIIDSVLFCADQVCVIQCIAE